MPLRIGPARVPPQSLEKESAGTDDDGSIAEPIPNGVSAQPGKSRVSVTLWGNNNPGQSLDDPNNDRQYTTHLRGAYTKNRVTDGQIQEFAVALTYDLFTENRVAPGALSTGWAPGKHRADMGTLIVSVRNTVELGDGFFFKRGVKGGVVVTGDLGGLGLQDGWHSLTHMGERKGLPDQYTQGLTFAGLVGVEASLWKRQEWGAGFSAEAGVGAGADVPLGRTGIGNARTHAQAGVGTPGGFHFDVGITGTLQWTEGKAFNFPKGGGPANGLVISPFGQVSWTRNAIETSVKVEGNAYGTGSPMGTLVVRYHF